MISICLINYNSFEDTIECIESLLSQSYQEFNIVIVDNCSSNNSVIELEKYLVTVDNNFNKFSDSYLPIEGLLTESRLTLITSQTNRGFSGGNNLGFLYIKHSLSSELVLFLNNDTRVPEDFLYVIKNEYSAFQQKTKSKVALGVKELNFYSHKNSHNGFHYLHLATALTFNFPVYPFFKYICGACLLVDVNAPFMDERYFLYFDDIEYSKILLKNDYLLFNTKKTHYYHKISASIRTNEQKSIFQFKSTWLFYDKNYPYYKRLVYFFRYIQYVLFNKKNFAEIVKKTYIDNGNLR